jgi:hypothetical protein
MYDLDIKNDFTVLTKEKNGDRVEGKILRHKEGKNFSIEPFSSEGDVK